MFHINVWLTVNDPGNVPRVRELLTQCCRGSRAEDGCERFEVYHSEADPGEHPSAEQPALEVLSGVVLEQRPRGYVGRESAMYCLSTFSCGTSR